MPDETDATRREFLMGVGALAAGCLAAPAAGSSLLQPPQPPAPSPPAITRLRLRAGAGRLEDLRRFYASVLECPVAAAGPGGLTVRAGSTEIAFESAERGEPFYHFAFNIPENLLASAKRWLAARTEVLRRPDGSDEYFFQSWNAHACYFLDPAGNILEFIARHNLRNGREGEFSARDILHVSEIGLVVDDVGATVSAAEKQLGMGVFAGSSSEQFAASGDDHRLLIIAKRGRVWNAGTKAARPAEVFPVEATLTGTPGTLRSESLGFQVVSKP